MSGSKRRKVNRTYVPSRNPVLGSTPMTSAAWDSKMGRKAREVIERYHPTAEEETEVDVTADLALLGIEITVNVERKTPTAEPVKKSDIVSTRIINGKVVHFHDCSDEMKKMLTPREYRELVGLDVDEPTRPTAVKPTPSTIDVSADVAKLLGQIK